MTTAIAFDHRPHMGDVCGVFIDHLPDGYPAHSHQFVEIAVTLTGSADHGIDDQLYRISAGDVYVLQGQTEHSFSHVSPDFTLCDVCIREDIAQHFTERLRELPGYRALFVLEPARRRAQEFPSRLRLTPAVLQDLVSLLQRMQTERRERREGFEEMIQAYLLQVIILLCRQYVTLRDNDTACLLRVSEALSYLEAHVLEPLRVSELATIANLSPRHFLRLFRQIYHLSPMERIIQLRIQHACELLNTGAYSVTDAAFASGFQDSNYFSRQFHRLIGCSPRDYRRIHGGANSPMK